MRRLLLLLVICLLTGCSARTTVDISLANNGTGSISVVVDMDAAAAAAVPNLQQQLDVSDLKKAGWVLSGPTKTTDGHTIVRLRHRFSSPTEANTLMTNLTGASGPFRDFQLTQDRSFSSVSSGFTGTVDLTKGINSFGDDSLAQQFGNPLGFDSAEVEKGLGIEWANSFPLDIKVELPGNSAAQSSPPVDKNGVWHIAYGQVTNLKTASTAAIILPGIYLAISGGLVLLAIAMLIIWRMGRYRPQHVGKGVRARDLLEQSKR